MSGAYDIDTLSRTLRTARTRVPIRPPQRRRPGHPFAIPDDKRTLLTDAYAATAVPAPVRSSLPLCACASPACLSLGNAEHSSASGAWFLRSCPQERCFDPGVTPDRRRRLGRRTSAGRRRSSSISGIADRSLAGPSLHRLFIRVEENDIEVAAVVASLLAEDSPARLACPRWLVPTVARQLASGQVWRSGIRWSG